jgi:hypothetical protein
VTAAESGWIRLVRGLWLLAVPATATVDPAGVHAGAAADAVEGLPEIQTADLTATVVHNHNMQFFALLRTMKV